ncbi:glycine zipper 2TM domain-containing protein [Roseovarius salis]|uniref:glycine zipper 2TM domain-containing protein n=1 Tax=Roseovarius salis TaxID=3376063 RepID=UPI0037CA23B7
MKRPLASLLFASILSLAACETPQQERELRGALIGGGLGLITAKALDADDNWVIVSTLAGAAAGALVARNTATGRCAYARGDGTYYRAPCR